MSYVHVDNDDGTDCAGNCRAWTDERGKVTTPWLHVAVVADLAVTGSN